MIIGTFDIIVLTLVMYSIVANAAYFISKENEDVLMVFGMGIFGVLLWVIVQIIIKIQKIIKNYNKRSIFKDDNGNKFYCKVKYYDDFCWHYDSVKRYANKEEWENLQPFTKCQIDLAQINCDRCKYDKDCASDGYYYDDTIRCKHDNYGTVTEFDKFEKK